MFHLYCCRGRSPVRAVSGGSEEAHDGGGGRFGVEAEPCGEDRTPAGSGGPAKEGRCEVTVLPDAEERIESPAHQRTAEYPYPHGQLWHDSRSNSTAAARYRHRSRQADTRYEWHFPRSAPDATAPDQAREQDRASRVCDIAVRRKKG